MHSARQVTEVPALQRVGRHSLTRPGYCSLAVHTPANLPPPAPPPRQPGTTATISSQWSGPKHICQATGANVCSVCEPVPAGWLPIFTPHQTPATSRPALWGSSYRPGYLLPGHQADCPNPTPPNQHNFSSCADQTRP